MKFITSNITALLAATAAFISPAALAAPAPLAAANAAPAPRPFSLKASTWDQRVNNKCLWTYHTGAGLNDVVLSDCGKDGASKIFASNASEPAKIDYLGFPAGTPAQLQAYSGGASYDVWAKVVANVGLSGSEFTYTETAGLRQKDNDLGFLACRWSHYGAWQLFALSRVPEPKELPRSCVQVVLKKVF